jgi:dTDP-4-amino-4,6-dideoxygalactose transaminase
MDDFYVPLIDLKERYLEEKTELLECVDRVLKLGHFVLTAEVSEFEDKVALYTGIKHCIGLNSGTDALMIGLHMLGIGSGDEVITTPISFIASTGSIAHVGAKPVFVDVRADQNINPDLIKSKISSRTRAIMPVHWGGRIADMDPIVKIAKENNLLIIEDAAQTMGASYKNKHGGSFSEVAAFSAHPLKNLNALGDGGFLLTNNDQINARARQYRNHGMIDRETALDFGVNSRLDSLNAEVLKYRLTKLDSILSRRRKNVEHYCKNIMAPEVFIPPCQHYEEHAYVMFLIQCQRRDELQAYLIENGVQSLVYYGKPLHLQPATEKYGYKKGDFPEAEKQCNQVLALPHHQHLTIEQIDFVCAKVNEFYN